MGVIRVFWAVNIPSDGVNADPKLFPVPAEAAIACAYCRKKVIWSHANRKKIAVIHILIHIYADVRIFWYMSLLELVEVPWAGSPGHQLNSHG